MKSKSELKRDRKAMKCVAFWVSPADFRNFKLRIVADGLSMQEWGERTFRRYVGNKPA